jgi:hypothetical protein
MMVRKLGEIKLPLTALSKAFSILSGTTNKTQRATIFFIIVIAGHQELKNCIHIIW